LYRVDRRQIGFVRYILEGYDNVAVLSTLDPRAAIIDVRVAPGCEALVEKIMDDLAKTVALVAVDRHPLKGPADPCATTSGFETKRNHEEEQRSR
jgi:hypothetical protein